MASDFFNDVPAVQYVSFKAQCL